LLVERGTSLNGHDPKEFCPLASAVIRGNPEIVRLLLEKGADVNGRMTPEQEKVNYAPLTMACNRRQWECGRILLEHGADPNIRDENDYTPLMMMQDEEQDLEFARLLIARGADVNARNDFCEVSPRFKALVK
jgi:ankyrin repeat protein